jgi:hypothetical protein
VYERVREEEKSKKQTKYRIFSDRTTKTNICREKHFNEEKEQALVRR